ncbi:MAG TPA: ATP-binding protein, partial [Gemmatimonadales bacterium]|nr:ATP-binding protein [Gemmatimonadales bacterium]
MSVPRSLRVPSLRGTLLVMLGLVVAYTVAIAIYLAISAGRAARLAQETESVAGIFQTLEARVSRGEVATRQTRLLLTRPGPVDRGALDRIRKSITPTERGALLALSDVPPVMRRSLSRADVRAAAVENAVFGAIAALELGDRATAMTKLGVADSIASWADDHVREAELLGLAELAARQNQFGQATNRVVTVVLVWAVLGLFFVPLVAFVWRRRVRLPLERLDVAMDAVAEGDLTVQVETRRDDEIGRIAEHFNAMTRVLHHRAEQQGRLAAAGELVAGVAHEVNNPLMAIALLAETNLDEEHLPTELRADLQQMLRQARRAGKLVAGLLRFVRPGEGTVIETLDLNARIRESLDLVSYQFSVDEIEVTQRLDPDVPPVECDGTRVEQVLVNLLSNAVQALRMVSVPRRLTLESWWEDGQVAFAVADNGPGIPAELRTRVFVPFFTTKGSRGTGLGLYISRQIMRELGGDLRVEAVEPRGVRFVASVPATAGARPVRAAAP